MRKASAIFLLLCFLIMLSACGLHSEPEQTAGVLSALEPQSVFSYFEKICTVPRGSGNTQAISNFVAAFADEQGLDYNQDEYGNVIIYKPAFEGYEDKEPIALQCHIDMVCAAKDESKDMTKEGIKPVTDGVKVWADGTSLGGDDGIGMAIIMSVLSNKELAHPAIEAIFTVDEETDLKGAYTVDVGLLKSTRMINLDSEEAGYVYVSCGGGKALGISIPVKARQLSGQSAFKIKLRGLCGGHSGEEIKFGRANAIKQTGELLYAALEKFDIAVSQWNGGVADNAIPKEAYIVCSVPNEQASDFESFVTDFGKKLKSAFSETDPDMELTIEAFEAFDSAVTDDELESIVTALHEMPDGVIKMSEILDGIPETSLNTGIINLSDGKLHIATCVRSSNLTALNAVVDEVVNIVDNCGGKYEIISDFPAWEYVEDSSLQELVMNSYKTATGKNAETKITHSGLECGIFYERIDGADIVSIGPDVKNAHTTEESITVETVAEVYSVLLDVLKNA